MKTLLLILSTQFLYYFYAAETAFIEEDWPTAYKLFRFCHSLEPDDPTVNLYMGIYHDGFDQRDQALQYYQKAWEREPEIAWKNYSLLLFKSKDEKERRKAIKVLEQTAKQLPANEEVWEALVQGYQATEQYSRVLTAQDRLDALVGGDVYSMLTRYRCYLLLDQPKKAVKVLNAYLKDDPCAIQLLPPNLLNNIAYEMALKHQDLDSALHLVEAAVKEEPLNPSFIDTYAYILYLKGDKEMAQILLNTAIRLLEQNNTPLPSEIKKHQKMFNR